MFHVADYALRCHCRHYYYAAMLVITPILRHDASALLRCRAIDTYAALRHA